MTLHKQVLLQVSHLLRCLFQADMSSEQNIKDLQAQNAQFQQTFVTLAKGQEDLKALILKEKKKKKKKKNKKKNKNKKKISGVLNLGRKFRGALKQPVDLTSSSKEGENQERETREDDPIPEVSNNDTDYNDEQYPPTEDRYK